MQGWLLSPRGPLHRRSHGDWAHCRKFLRGAVSCALLAAQAHGVPICVKCFPDSSSPYGRGKR